MTYVGGYVVPVPETKIEEYRKLAEAFGILCKEFGALSVVECVADDVQEGKWTDFYRAVDRQPGETVMFSWILFKSREDRDEIMGKVMADPRLNMNPATMPFDGKRMIFGGFRPIVEL